MPRSQHRPCLKTPTKRHVDPSVPAFNRVHEPWSGYNTRRWKRVRRIVLQNMPACLHCWRRGIVTTATDVDHVRSVRERPDLAFAIHNLQPLCKACHARKGHAAGELATPRSDHDAPSPETL